MQELRIEDCTSDAGAERAPWEDAMRVMPPLLELADMFNLILRRCRASRADSDLVRGGRACAQSSLIHRRPPVERNACDASHSGADSHTHCQSKVLPPFCADLQVGWRALCPYGRVILLSLV